MERPCFRRCCHIVLLVLVVAAAALAFRLQKLDVRPFHADEAVQAVKAGELYDSGQYIYNPFEYHGPSLYYFTWPVLKLSGARQFAGATDANFRVVPVVFGVGLILLLLPLWRWLGGVATLVAAVMLAVSPAMVFFSRYYIQEIPLVFFAALALCALWRMLVAPGRGSAILLGTALGLMFATKETSVIFFAAMAVGYGGVVIRRCVCDGRCQWSQHRRDVCLLGLAVAVAAVVAFLFYSSLLAHPRGPLDSLLAFRHYFQRSGGDGSTAVHQHPWYYYLKLLAYTKDAPGPWWSEGFILLFAVFGLAASLRGRMPAAIHPELALFLALYTLCMTVAFSAIPYKTPWNMLGFLHALILMAGIGAGFLFHRAPRWFGYGVLPVLVLLGSWHLAVQAHRSNIRFCADPRNPCVYAHSVPDVILLSRHIHDLAAIHPDGLAMRVHFISPDYWPMPYYLRDMQRIGYWNGIPPQPDAPVIVVSADLQEQLQPLLRDRYHAKFFGLRPGVLLVLNVQQDLWDRHLQAPPPHKR